MPGQKITELTSLASNELANDDVIPIVDTSAGTTKKIAVSDFKAQTGPVLVPAGTAGAPGLAFALDTNTGITSPGADQIGFSVGGVINATLSGTAFTPAVPVINASGSAAAPSVTFSGDTNTGIYSPGAEQVGVTTGGVDRLTVSDTAVTSTVPVVVGAGSAAAPSVTFTGNTSTGILSPASNQVGITTAGTQRLSVSNSAVTSTIPVVIPAGSAAAPSLTISGDTNTGLNSPAADQIAISTGGTDRLTVSTTTVNSALPILGVNGSAANPSVSFANDTNTGLFSVGLDQIGISTGGTQRVAISDSVVTSAIPVLVPNGADTLPSIALSDDTNTGIYSPSDDQLAITTGGTRRVTVSTTDVTSTLPLLTPDGSSTNPSFSFTNDTNTGIFSSGVDQIAIATGGTQRVSVSTTGVTSTLPVLIPNGSVTAPAIAMSDDTNTGIYSPNNDELAITTAGTERLSVSATNVTSTLPILVPNGSATAPSVAMSDDTNTGIYSPNDDEVAVTTGGTRRLTVSTTDVTSTLPLLIPNGSVSAPSIAPSDDTDTGIYSPANDQIAIGTAGVRQVLVTSTEVTVTPPILATAGTAADPGYSFNGSPATGIFRPTAGGTLGFSMGGTEVARFTGDGLAIGTDSPVSQLHIVGAGSATGQSRITVERESDDTVASRLTFRKARGTPVAPTVPADNDNIGVLRFESWDSTTWLGSAQIIARVDGGVSSGDVPAELLFQTTPDASSTPTERLILNTSGAEVIGRIRLNGCDAYATNITIADDAVATVSPVRTGGFLLMTCGGGATATSVTEGASAFIRFDIGSVAASISKNSGFADIGSLVDVVTGTTLTGTTGTDGNITVSARTDGTLMIENRFGSSRTFNLWVF